MFSWDFLFVLFEDFDPFFIFVITKFSSSSSKIYPILHSLFDIYPHEIYPKQEGFIIFKVFFLCFFRNFDLLKAHKIIHFSFNYSSTTYQYHFLQ